MKYHLIGSSPSKERLAQKINEYFFSTKYQVTEDAEGVRLTHTDPDKTLPAYFRVTKVKGRYRFEAAE